MVKFLKWTLPVVISGLLGSPAIAQDSTDVDLVAPMIACDKEYKKVNYDSSVCEQARGFYFNMFQQEDDHAKQCNWGLFVVAVDRRLSQEDGKKNTKLIDLVHNDSKVELKNCSDIPDSKMDDGSTFSVKDEMNKLIKEYTRPGQPLDDGDNS